MKKDITEKAEFIASPNWSGRKRSKIEVIVIHYTASMNIDGTVEWFLNPASDVSSHYIIGRDGVLIQMVLDQEKAWHAGKSSWLGKKDVNRFSIGIELVGTRTSGFTSEQYKILNELVTFLCQKYSISASNVVGHQDVSPGRKIDPGPLFDWNRLYTYLDSLELTKEIDKMECGVV